MDDDFILSRFYDEDSSIEKHDIENITFLNKSYSSYLWKKNISNSNHLSQTKNSDRIYLLSYSEMRIDWNNFYYSSDCFSNILKNDILLLYFWGPLLSCFVSKKIFCSAWDDFFYPSDENCVLIGLNSYMYIYSFNEIFYNSSGAQQIIL